MPPSSAQAESLPLTADSFLLDSSEPPLDEDEIREALACALTEQAPPALVRLVGKQAYTRCGAVHCRV